MATGGLGQSSDSGLHNECFEDVCSRCEGKGRHVEAVHYCSSCNKHLCPSCYDLHQREFSSERRHTIFTRSRNVECRIPDQQVGVDSEKCSKHPDQELTLFCGQHAQLCCPKCVTEHGACENIEIITENLYGNAQRDEAKVLHEDLRQILDTVRDIKDAKEKARSSYNDFREEYKILMKSHRETIDAVLKSMENETDKKMMDLYQKRSAQMQNDIDKCEEVFRIITGIENDIDRKYGDKTDVQMYVAVKKAKENILVCKEKMLAIENSSVNKLQYCPNDRVVNYLGDLIELGQFQDSPVPIAQCQDVRYSKEMNVHSAEDQHKCDIRGMCQLLDGSIILADNRNGNLKHLNRSYHVVDVCAVAGKPHRVCRVGKIQIAVAMGKEERVQFAIVTDKIYLTSSIPMKHKCYGIACQNDILYVTNGTDKTFIYDIKTYVPGVKCLPLTRVLSNRPTSVAFDYCFSRLVLANEADDVFLLDSDGNVNQKVKVTVYGKSDACVDDKGNTFVITRANDSIVKFWNGDEKARISSFPIANFMSDTLTVDTLQSNLLLQKNNSDREGDNICVYKIDYRSASVI